MSLSDRPALAERDLGRGHRTDAHDVRRDAGRPPRHQPDQRGQPEFGGLLRRRHDAHRGGVVLPAGVAGGDGGVRIIACSRTGFSLASDSTEVSARGCSSVSMSSSPCRVRTVDRDDLLGEDAVLLRGDRPLMRRHREFVLFLPRDAVLAAQVLGGLEHAARHRVVPPARGGAAAREPVVHLDAAAGTAPAHVGGVEGDIAHALRAAGDDEIVVAAAHLQARLDDGLQTRSAAPVDLHTGNGDRQAGVQRDHATDRRRLAVGIAVPEDHVLHRRRARSRSGRADPSARRPRGRRRSAT